MTTQDGGKEARITGRWNRRAVRIAALLVSLVLVLPWTPWPQATAVLPSASPFIAVGALLAGAAPSVVMLGAVLIGVVCLWSRRFFCRYLCPMGLLLDCASLAPYRKMDVRRVPRIGPLLVTATLAGAAFGFPLFLWLDPLSLFSALFGNRYHDGLWLAPAFVIGVSALLPRIWCTRLCPLGATQDILRWPADARTAWTQRSSAQRNASTTPTGSALQLKRRTLLATLGVATAGAIGAWAGRRCYSLTGQNSGAALRPPGAVDPARFSAVCVRCGNCMQVCPSQILQPDWSGGSLLSLASPVLQLEADYCREDCNACTQVCPSGAIQRLSLDEKLDYQIGQAAIEFDLCLLAYNRECEICKRVCPRDAVTFAWSEEEYTVIPKLDLQRCNGCGACLVACPGENEWEREADAEIPVRKAISIS